MIRRRYRPRTIEFQFDSFLDLVANVVGIILRLILVAWFGARSYSSLKKLPRPTSPPQAIKSPGLSEPDTSAEEAALKRLQDEIARAEVALLHQLAFEPNLETNDPQIARTMQEKDRTRAELAMQARSLAEKQQLLEQKTSNTVLKLSDLKERSRKLQEQLAMLNRLPRTSKTLHYQTPVAEVVQSEELQFECQGGRVTFLDVEAMLRDIQRGLRDKGEQLRTQWEIEDRSAPIGAFRLRYVIARQRELLDSVASPGSPNAQANFSYGLDSWVAEPVDPHRGESAEKALQANSEFRRIVDRIDPQQTAVTFWVYPDSFPLYRQLRDYLVRREVLVAGRPLPRGFPIASSRRGTVSRGQ